MIITHDQIPLESLRSLYLSPQPLPEQQLGPLNSLRILVTGGAGFVGSHLVDRLMLLGASVTVLDDLSTGTLQNISHWQPNPKFTFIRGDVMSADLVSNLPSQEYIFHLASPASPPQYQRDPVKTLMTNVQGTLNMLQLAARQPAFRRFLLASTSEVYGDPEVHPQREDYCGRVNSLGPRACYDEGKRCAETLVAEYARLRSLPAVILRIFNTFGPRMQPDDGRVVSNFINQALQGGPLLIHGDGTHTRSFQFIHDLVDAMLAAAFTAYQAVDDSLPINVGCPQEFAIRQFAQLVIRIVGTGSMDIVEVEGDVDDPKRRKPDIEKARRVLNWSPKWTLEDGLLETVAYFRQLGNK